MKSDFELIVKKFDSDVTVIPIADVHLGAIEHNEEAWTSFCTKIMEQENTYLVLVGDLIQNGVRNSVGNPLLQTMPPSMQKAAMVDYLTPLRSRIICGVQGNHEARTKVECDQDVCRDIFCKLDIEDNYRENMAFLKIQLGERMDKSRVKGTPICSYVFVVTHGASGGVLPGSQANKNTQFGNVVSGAMDVLVTGHTHKGMVLRPQKIFIDDVNNRVSLKPYTIVTAESWLDYGGYAMRKMLLPFETCNPQKIKLKMSHNKKVEIVW